MSFFENRFARMSTGATSTPRKRGPEKKIQPGELCQVCNEQATGFNYGALTCNPCKSFFRRTVLENNLTQKCDRGGACYGKFIRRCIDCRLAKCELVGMNADYIRDLRIRSIRRRIQKIPTNGQLMKFSETLDPFQENFLAILEGFWIIYRNKQANIHEPSLDTTGAVQRTAYEVVVNFENKLSTIKQPNPFFQIALDRLHFVKDVINLHASMMLVFLEAIPSIRWHQLQEETKRELITFGTMEIPLIRSGSRSLSGIPPNRGQFEGTGLRDWVIKDMFAIIEDFSIKLHPDSYETALIAALAATSPDRGISSAVDYKILSNIQETILEILRIKLGIDRKQLKVLASFIAFLQKLREYSHNSSEEWWRFISHKKKIFMAQQQEKEVVRTGMDFVAQGRT